MHKHEAEPSTLNSMIDRSMTQNFKYNTLLITYPILKRSRITPNTASQFQYEKIDLFI